MPGTSRVDRGADDDRSASSAQATGDSGDEADATDDLVNVAAANDDEEVHTRARRLRKRRGADDNGMLVETLFLTSHTHYTVFRDHIIVRNMIFLNNRLVS